MNTVIAVFAVAVLTAAYLGLHLLVIYATEQDDHIAENKRAQQ
jgi:hypothetical protein